MQQLAVALSSYQSAQDASWVLAAKRILITDIFTL